MAFVHVNLTKEKYSFSELVEYHKAVCCRVSQSRIDWSDFWLLDFPKLNKETVKVIWGYTKLYDMVPTLVRVLFARYGAKFTDVFDRLASVNVGEGFCMSPSYHEGLIKLNVYALEKVSSPEDDFHVKTYYPDARPVYQSEIKIPWLHAEDLKPYSTIDHVITYRYDINIYKIYD